MNLAKITSPDSLKKYQKYLKGQNLPQNTIDRKLSSLRRFNQFTQNSFLKKEFPRTNQSESKDITIPRNNVNLNSLYSKYTASRISTYLHISILVLFSVAMGIFGYSQIFKQALISQAYPQAPNPTTPNRILSFQARLTDSSDNPITTATDMRFALYNDDTASGAAQLWEELRYIDPDQDGIFSVQLGTEVDIASRIFTEYSNLWLGVTVEVDPEATPRQPIATVGYALNAETLQGFPPSASASADQIPVLTQEGDLVLAAASPQIYSSSGTFAITGQALSVVTDTGTNGSITIAPDGTGSLNLTGSTTTQNFIRVTNANLSSGHLISGYVGNDTATGDLLNLSSGASEVEKFAVNQAGDTAIAGDLQVNGGQIGIAADTDLLSLTSNLLTVNGGVTATGTITASGGLVTKDSGNLTLSTTTSGNLILTTADDLVFTGFNSCTALETDGSGILSCGVDDNGGSYAYWRLASGALSPVNDTLDLLIGSNATTSAKFAFINVDSGTPTASIAGSTAGYGVYLTGDGTLSTTLNRSLLLNPSGGNVGIGTATPGYTLDVQSTITSSPLLRAIRTGTTRGLTLNTAGIFTLGSDAVGATNYAASLAYTLNRESASGAINNALGINSTISPTAGDTDISSLYIKGTVNQTGTATGDIRGIYIEDTLTSVLGSYRALEIANNAHYGIYQSGASAANYFAGNTGIGDTTPGTHLVVGSDAGLSIADTAGNAYFAGAVEIDGATTLGNVAYTWPGADGTANYILKTDGAGTLSWADPAGAAASAIPWVESAGILYPKNSTVDLLVGGQATASAKFAVLNINSGTPTASISANSGNIATYLTGDGTLATTNRQSLTIGNSSTYDTTGNVLINSNGQGNVGIGTTTPSSKLDITTNALGTTQTTASGLALVNTTAAAAGAQQISPATRWSGLGWGTTAGTSQAVDFQAFVLPVQSTVPTGLWKLQSSIAGGAYADKFVINTSGQIVPNSTAGLNDTSTGIWKVSTLQTGNHNETLTLQSLRQMSNATSRSMVQVPPQFISSSGAGKFVAFDVAPLINQSGSATGDYTALQVNVTETSALGTNKLLADFQTGGNSKMVINSAGNVGIGTTTPTALLDVAGTASISGELDLYGTAQLQSTSQLSLIIGGDTTGNILFQPNADTGDYLQLTSDGTDLTLATTDSSALNITAAGAVSVDGTGASNVSATSGDLTLSTITSGDLILTTAGNLVLTGFNDCTALETDGSGILSCGSDASDTTNYWRIASGGLSPVNDTLDLLIGSNATASAKFGFLNVGFGTPVASISANSGNIATYLTGDGTLATTNRQSLTIGNSSTYDTTGNVLINPNGTGNIFIGDTSNANSTFGVTINQGANDDEILALKSSDVAHGQTDYAETDTFGLFKKETDSTGGLLIKGFKDVAGANVSALALEGYLSDTSGSTGRTVDTQGVITLSGFVSNGTTGRAGLGSDENLLVIRNGTTARIVFDSEGTLHQVLNSDADVDILTVEVTGTPTLSWDESDDAFDLSKGLEITSGNFVLNSSGTTTFNTVAYTWPGADGSANYILKTDGAGTLSWVDPAGAAASAIPWVEGAGILYPKNSTLDLLVGGQATASAKFAVLNINSGTPTASISANSGNIATYLTGDGTLATTNRQSLTIGNSTTYDTTGNVLINSNGQGNVGIGTTTPAAKLESLATTEQLRLSYDSSTPVKFTVDSAGQLLIDASKTASAGYIRFKVSGASNPSAEVFTIKGGSGSAGYIGVNNTDPTYQVDVGGTGRFTYGGIFATSGTVSTDQNITIDGTTIDANKDNANLNIRDLANINYDWYVSTQGSEQGAIIFNTATPNTTGATTISEAMRIVGSTINDGGGLVGIGTTAPVARLEVNAEQVGKALVIFDQDSLDQDIFAASSSGVTKFVIDNDGNVGIGTAGPSYPLEVVGDIAMTKTSAQGYIYSYDTTSADFIRLYHDGTYGYLDVNTTAGIITDNSFYVTGDNNIYVDAVYLGYSGSDALLSTQGTNENLTIDPNGSGTTTIQGNLIIGSSGTTTFNNVEYTWPGADGTANYILKTDGAGTLSWTDPAGAAASAIPWVEGAGILYPKNSTLDLLVGGQATASAKFAVLNINSGTPVASISANSGNIATYLTGDGTLATTNRQSLTIGNSSTYDTTGNVLINSNGQGNVGIGTSAPTAKLEVNGTSKFQSTIQTYGAVEMWGAYTLVTDNIELVFGNGSDYAMGYNSSNDTLQFVDGGTLGTNVRITLNSSGNVGIGTTTPTALLDVAGTASISGELDLYGTAQLQSTSQLSLTIGGDTTGNILFQPNADTGDYVTLSSDGTNLTLATTDSSNLTINPAGNLVLSGALVDINASANLDIDVTGTTDILSSSTFSIDGTGASNVSATSGDLTLSTITSGDLVLTAADDVVLTGFATCTALETDGSGILSCGSDDNGSSFAYWRLNEGTISPVNDTLDLLIGSNATASAKFAVINVNDGTPTASISANSGNIATYLTGDGTLSTTNRQSLTIGNSSTYNTTGNVLINSNGQGNVGIETTTPVAALDVRSTQSHFGANGGNFYIDNNTLNFAYTGNEDSGGWINFRGYQDGTTQFRDLTIGDGKGTAVAFFDGSTGNVGIGTLTPTALLDVAGTASISGELDLYGTAQLQSTSQLSLTIGGDTTGNILFQPNADTTDYLQLTSDGTDLTLATTDSSNLTINPAGNLVLSGALVDVNASANLDIDVTGTTDILSSSTFSIDGTGASNVSATSGNLTLSTITSGDLILTKAGNLVFTGFNCTGNANGGALTADASGIISCTDDDSGGGSGSSNWRLASGSLSPINDTLDILVGSNATTSAKFAVLNVNDGVPTASVSGATLGQGGAFFTGAGAFGTIDQISLTVGGATTGNILFQPNSDTTDYLQLTSDGTNLTLATTDSSNLTINPAGNLVLTGALVDVNASANLDIDVTGTTDILSSSTFSIDGTGASNVSATSGDLTLSTITSGSLILDSAGLVDINAAANLDIDVTGTTDILSSSTFSIDGTGASNVSATSGDLTLSTITTGDLVLTAADDIVLTGFATCTALETDGSGILSCGSDDNGGSYAYWRLASGALSPVNDTLDLLIGSNATTSAKFAVLNVNDGVPTASVSSGLSGTSAFLTADGNLATQNLMSLTLGGTTTGNLFFHGTTYQLSKTGDLTLGGRITFENGEYMENETDDLISFYGTGGSDNTDLIIDLDGTRPAIYSATDTAVEISDNLYIYDFIGTTQNSVNSIDLHNNGVSMASYLNIVLALDNDQGDTGEEFTLYTNGGQSMIWKITQDGGAGASATGLMSVNDASPDANLEISANGTTGGDIFLLSSDDDTDGDLFLVSHAGEVGIGTITPTALLDVAGTASISGELDLYGTAQLQSTSQLSLTIGGDTTGNILFQPNADTGDYLQLTSSGTDLTLASTDGSALNITAAGAISLDGTGASNVSATSGNLTVSTITSGNLILTTAADLVLTGFNSCTALETDGSGILSCGVDDNGGSYAYWRLASGALSPVNDTLDLLIGSNATTSAKFAVLNVNDGTPTASVSGATLGQGGAFFTGAGAFGTIDQISLTVGGATTGNILFQPNSDTGDYLQLTSDGTNLTLATTDSSNLTINPAGNLVLSGALVDVNASANLDIDVTGTVDILGSSTFSLDGTGASNVSATSGNLTLSTITSGNLILTAADDVVLTGFNSCTALETDGSGILSCGSDAEGSGGSSNWRISEGAISPVNDTLDLLIGSNATASAKFAVINVNDGTPTASISANSGNIATYLTGDGTLSTTNRQSLTIGNSSTYNTTGNVLINSNGQGNVGIGTTAPEALLEVQGASGTDAIIALDADAGTDDNDTWFIESEAADNDLSFVQHSTERAKIDVNGYFYSQRFVDLASSSYYLDPAASGDSLIVAGQVGIGQTSADYMLDVVSPDTTGAFQIVGDSITTGDGINLSFDGLSTGNGLYLESTSTALTSGSLANFYWNPGSSTTATGDLFKINIGANGLLTGNIFTVQDNASDLFSVSQAGITSALPHAFTAAGDVSVAYDLILNNQTASKIEAYGPLTIEAGESFENNDLTIKTYGTGALVVDAAGGSEFSRSGAAVGSFNRTTSDGTIISLQQAGTEEGTISVSGTTVSYNAFTGSHYAWSNDPSLETYQLVSMTDSNKQLHDRSQSEILYGIATTATENDSKILGIYLSPLESNQALSTSNPHLVMAVGNADLYVVNNGQNINTGDYLISSTTPGHAQKDPGTFATSYVIARAAEPVDWSQVDEVHEGKKRARISVLIENFPLDRQLSSLLTLNKTGQVESFATVYAEDQILQATAVNNLFTQIAQLRTDLNALIAELRAPQTLLSPLAVTTQNLTVTEDATVSGTLVVNELVAENITSSTIDMIRERVEALAQSYQEQTATASSTQDIAYQYWLENLQNYSATDSADSLNLTHLEATSGFFSDYLAVLGNAVITDLDVTNNLSVSSITSTTGSINFLAGVMIIDSTGSVAINGNLTVAGEVLAEKVTSPQGYFDELLTQNLISTGSAKFKELSTEGLIIASSIATPSAIATSSASITTNATAGKAVLPAGQTEYTIYTPHVSADTLTYVTPIGDTQNQVLYVKAKQVGEWFKVAINQPLPYDLEFNWWTIKLADGL